MIKENIEEILWVLENSIASELVGGLDNIKSLRIDRRKPHTDRLFFMLPSDSTLRVCLHTFQECSLDDSFPHPHSWESEVLILDGKYDHRYVHHVPLDFDALNMFKLASQKHHIEHLIPGNSYHITSPKTWHKVTPLTECRTIMINGPTWSENNRSVYCKFTKGKELIELPKEEKKQQIQIFINLINNIINKNI